MALVVESFGIQMVAVAIGWQVFAVNRSAFDLGLVGLFEFVPLLLLALPAGQLADRISRRLMFAAALALNALVAIALLAVTIGGATELWPFLALAAGNGDRRCDREPLRPGARPLARLAGAASELARAALDRLPERHRRRARRSAGSCSRSTPSSSTASRP